MVNVSRENKLKTLNKVLGAFYKKGEEALFRCPRCDHHKKKLSINIEKNVFKCWVCDWSGKNLYRIIRQYGDNDTRYHWKSFQDKIEIEKFSHKLFAGEEETAAANLSLPEEFISLANSTLPSTSIYPLNYLKSRGIDKKTIIKWKIGYCPKGEYASRVIIPSFDKKGEVNYFVSRAYDGGWKKYLNPKVSKNIIFNHPYINFDEDIILVEGVFDAMKAGDNSIPLLGSTLSEESKLFNEIVRNDSVLYLALDPDATKKTNKLISLFLKYDIRTHVVDISGYEDVGEMHASEFFKRKETAALLNSNNYLLSRIMRI